MNITNIISAIGNNSSVYPLIVRDCGIEVPTKIVLTYNQNKKESKKVALLAARERFLDEYAVSAVWLGGIPLVGKIADYFIKKAGYNPDVNLKLFNGSQYQNIQTNIENFKGKVPQNILDDLAKVAANKSRFEKLLAGKFLASTIIPTLFMGFILPKIIFASSAKKIEEQRKLEANKRSEKQINTSKLSQFMNNKKISFKGWVTKAANFSTVDKMAMTDGGYAVGRVVTARNKNEALDVGFKMAGMMFLNFVAPKYIQKIFDKTMSLATGLEVSLDPKMFENKDFLDAIKNKKLNLPTGNSEKEILEFIDQNPNSLFVKLTDKFKKIKMLKNGIRDPRQFVDIKELVNFKNDISKFAQKASIDMGQLRSFAKKAKWAKSINIISNITLSSFLLAYALPKAQFAFRKMVTGSDLEPGLAVVGKELKS